MQNKRDSFIFYRSYAEALIGLSNKSKLNLLNAIIKNSLDFEEIELKNIEKNLFSLIKPQIEANNRKFINGCKGSEYGNLGGRPRKEKETPRKPQENPKKTPNVNVNDNVNDNVNEKENFINELNESEDFKNALNEWLNYGKKKYKTLKQWNFQYNKLKEFKNYSEVVDFSIGCGYQGLYAPTNNKKEIGYGGLF